jgi:hypothetical protein
MLLRLSVPIGPGSGVPAAILTWLSGLLVSCATGFHSPDPEKAPILSTAVGPALKALWDRSGGIAAWRKIESVWFVYEMEVVPGALAAEVLGGLSAPSAEPGAGAGAPGGIGPMEIGFLVDDWGSLEAGAEEGRTPFLLQEEPQPGLLDYALRSIRVFFCFPFVLAEPGWEFRQEIIAGESEAYPWEFWLLPVGIPSPHRVYFVEIDRKTGLLRAVYYQSAHPVLSGKTLKAVFGGYRIVRGIQVATEIAHFLCGPRPGPAGGYPWEEAPLPAKGAAPGQGAAGDLLEESLLFREKISSIDFQERPSS